ncbi:MAG TPA: hypothetical protein VMT02_04715 [Burkholderiales bacterium]|jgi:hypothetical protein|nr:hypothetical protein [Burkholderiales bacterium]
MRRNATIALLCLAGLAGCSTEPMSLADRGKRYEFTVDARPQDLAGCIAANAVAPSGYYTASVSNLVRPDSYEVAVTQVYVRPVNLDYRAVIIVARTSPAESKSRLELFLSESLGAAAGEEWLARLRQGCWS